MSVETKLENPPAFPRVGYENEIGEWMPGRVGMTLRDYFAAKAMQGLLAQETEDWRDNDASISERAFGIADAMLKERSK